MTRAWTDEYAIVDKEQMVLLLVDDDRGDREAVRRALRTTTLAADVWEVNDIEQARSALTRQGFDCVLLDAQLSDQLDVIGELRRRGLGVPVIMLTSASDPETALVFMKGGASDVLPKRALSADRVEAAVRAAVRLSRAERALRASQAWASTAMRSIGDAVVTSDATGTVTYMNRAAEELTGWPPALAVGRPLAEVADCRPEKAGGPALAERVTQVLTGRTSASQADMVLHARDGRRVPVDVRIARVRAERRDGVPPEGAVGAVMALRDITDRKAAARALELARADAERARAEAEAANRAKSEFLATMSHELRTPLNAIGGFTELIADEIYGPVTERQREALVRIKRAQELLLGLINAVLNFAKVQAGRVPLHLAPFDVARVLDDVRPLVLPQLMSKQVAFTVRAPDTDGAPIVAFADQEKVQQIVLNLLSNATKFTPRGGRVELGWSATEELVRVTVTDTGVGMPAERLADVFEPFVQLGSDRTTVGQGTGLGLAISRELARSMNGELIAESTVDVGSIFTLLLPRVP